MFRVKNDLCLIEGNKKITAMDRLCTIPGGKDFCPPEKKGEFILFLYYS